jgi:hypothetical protein
LLTEKRWGMLAEADASAVTEQQLGIELSSGHHPGGH